MTIRVTQNLLYSNYLARVREGYAAMLRNQDQVSSGKRITRMSDDPADAARVLLLAEQHQTRLVQRQNLDQANALLSAADTSLQSVSSLLTEARTIALQGANDALSEPDREGLADRVDALLEELISAANSTIGGRYVFGGSRTSTQPFTGSGGEVAYQGNSDAMRVEIGPGTFVAANVPGGEIFLGGERGLTRFTGATGARAGTGPDTGVGVWQLDVTHDATVFLGSSGAAAGQSSASGDTILGQHQLTFTAAGANPATVSLDGGPAVSFTGTETDLKVTSKSGDVVYLDVTAVSAGFSGDDAIEGHGSLQAQGGARVAIDFAAADQQVKSGDGRLLHVDPRAITRSGQEQVTFTGTLSVFEALAELARDLRSSDAERSGALASRIANRVEDLDLAKDRVLQALSSIGGRQQRAQFSDARLTDLDVVVTETRATLEEVDITQAAAELAKNETAFQAALAVGQRIGQLSLLNYLA